MVTTWRLNDFKVNDSSVVIFSTNNKNPLGVNAVEILFNKVVSNLESSAIIKWYPSVIGSI